MDIFKRALLRKPLEKMGSSRQPTPKPSPHMLPLPDGTDSEKGSRSSKSSDSAGSVVAAPPVPDLAEVQELVQTMKKTLSTLGNTFDKLGEQTAKVAALGPAIDSAHQVSITVLW